MGKVNKFDIAIVGAGPAGIFACMEIIKKSPRSKIALFEMGKESAKRPLKDVMRGFGGAGTYSDGKLQFTPKLSHERALELISEEKYQNILNQIDKTFITFGSVGKLYPTNPQEVQQMIEEAEKNDIELIVRNAKHLGSDQLKNIILKFEKFLVNNKVAIFFDTEIADLVFENNKFVGLKDAKGDKYFCGKALLCPGRVNAKWLQNMANKYKMKFRYGMVEVGVRVEFPESIMRRHAETLYEIVFKIRTKTFDDIMRTFCTCPNGYVAIETYHNHICVNGHSTSTHESKNSNFAFLQEVNLTEPVENSLAYAESIAELTSTIGGGKPILQRLADLKKGRRSTWGRIGNSLIKPSLTDVTPGDIAMALPHRVVVNILEGLEMLDKVMPGINAGSTLLYAPEVKFRSTMIATDSDMETTVKNVYVAGDASGLSGTITGAAATGIMAARGMLKINR